MSMPLSFVPALFFLLWLGLIAYVIVLATRFVSAVEQIARALTQRFPESPRP